MVLAFTGHYASVQVLARFLELAGLTVVKSRVTTPAIVEAGTTLASTDFCLPLRVHVGHAHHLLQKHPDLDAIVAPNVLSEDGMTATCSKYRDVGGVVIRSLGDTIGCLLRHQPEGSAARLAALVGSSTLTARRERSARLPSCIMPDIRSLDRVEMKNVCIGVYADVMGWSPAHKAAFFLPARLRPILAAPVARLEPAFDQAYQKVVGRRGHRLPALLADPTRPRLALVGRRYLIDDTVLSCDLKQWFQKRGVSVLTANDLPSALLRQEYGAIEGFYEAHKEGQAFIRWAAEKVDGFICLGSFGCHPDAFQVDYLAAYARSFGAPCWTFRFDEAAGSTGFHTRFETILSFLEQRRDQRLTAPVTPAAEKVEPPGAAPVMPAPVTPAVPERRGESRPVSPCPAARPPAASKPLKPLIIWPYMGEILNLLVEEACHQLGLQDFMFPPAPLAEDDMLLGNNRYTDSCSPYACSTGSLKQTLARALDALEKPAREAGQPVEPRRIIVLMARGEGPCTFGWYAIMQNKHIPEEFGDRLAAVGHTIEWITMGLDGFVDTLSDLCHLSGHRHLRPLFEFAVACHKGMDRLPWWRRAGLRLRFSTALRALTRPLWAKLDLAEHLRASALILRAHELKPGSITAAYREALECLRRAHTVKAMAAAHRQGLALLAAVPRDQRIKPRVVTVGEIYVALTSFANRGTVENLLAREGIEVVEGPTLGRFMRSSLREMRRRNLCQKPWLRPLLAWLRGHNVDLFGPRIRDPRALPFMNREVGGEGMPSVAHARHYVEEGCDGIVHLYPFKCMPEGVARGAVKEVADLYGVRYLALSFDKETEIERLRTEVSTFAALLHAQVARETADDPFRQRRRRKQEIRRRRAIGRVLMKMYDASQRHRRSKKARHGPDDRYAGWNSGEYT